MDLVRDGVVRSDTLVWNATFGNDWKPAKKIPYLFQSEEFVEHDECKPDMSNKDILYLGKESLTGFWEMFGIIFGLFVFVDILAYMTYFLFAKDIYIPVLAVVAAFHVPLYFSLQVMFMRTARGAMPFFVDVFRGLRTKRDYLRVWGATLWIWVFMSGWIALYYGVRWGLHWFFIITPLELRHSVNDHFWGLHLLGLSTPSFLTGKLIYWIWRLYDLIVPIVLFFVYLTRYSMTYFILYGHRDISPFRAVRQSSAMLRGHRGKLFRLYGHFLAWLMPLAIILWIGSQFMTMYMRRLQWTLWSLFLVAVFLAVYTCLYPHMRMAHAHFYRMLKKKNEDD